MQLRRFVLHHSFTHSPLNHPNHHLKDILNSRQNRSKNKLVGVNPVTRREYIEVARSRLWAPGFRCSADPSCLVYIVYSARLVFEPSLFLFFFRKYKGTKAYSS